MTQRSNSFISDFLKLESAGGILLVIAAVLAIICANSPLNQYYEQLLSTYFSVSIGDFKVAKPLILWINDGLMAVFFFMIGLELKRELIEGELSDPKNIALPAIGAFGGMVFPALIYWFFNRGDEFAIQGWAIPAATDIAFALGVLSLFGSRVPISIKIFLASLAIFDDIGAILIIAIFYTDSLSIGSLIIAFACLPILFLLNKRNVLSIGAYVFIGIIMWTATLKSGVHATLAGITLAMFIPMKSKANPDYSPLKELEHSLHFKVAFIILPIFAFANAGLNLHGVGLDTLTHGVSIGIILGLFAGKQIGVFSMCLLAVKLKWAQLPTGVNLSQLYGASALCGIGFTMSLFIGGLAFIETDTIVKAFDERLGIIVGSLASGIVGYFVLNKSLPNAETIEVEK